MAFKGIQQFILCCLFNKHKWKEFGSGCKRRCLRCGREDWLFFPKLPERRVEDDAQESRND